MAELFHRRLERSSITFVIAIIAAASVGGIVEIAPLLLSTRPSSTRPT
jgi:cytochrome c oxidase cbb3-type subunit 2